jgi:flavin reductase (DIM6/NTAB) family NADH-FMN oxidoreductase RutF
MSELALMPSSSDRSDRDQRANAWELNSGRDTESFRAAMRRVISGVTVITTHHQDRPWGMTVSAFTPVCMEPPTLLVCVNNSTKTASDISRDGDFAVNLLSQAQLYLSQLCSRTGQDKYLDDHVVRGDELPAAVRAPVLRDSIVTFGCKATDILSIGSHLVVIGAIESILAPRALPPLLYGEGRYLHGVAIAANESRKGAGS